MLTQRGSRSHEPADRVGQISVGIGAFVFHAVVQKCGLSNYCDFETETRRAVCCKLRQISETSLRWASVSPSMYRWVVWIDRCPANSLNVAQRPAGMMHEPGRAGDEGPAAGMGRAAVKANDPDRPG